MAGVNKVILLGNLGSDPEVRYLDSGSVVAKFNIATSESYTTKGGERVEQTEWHKIELWDNLAKTAEQYLKKGNTVYVEGKIKTEQWTDKDGVQKSGIRIRATSMTLVGGRRESAEGDSQPTAQSAPAASRPAATPPAASSAPAFDSVSAGSSEDDLPF
ncbi:MAG: single-stranded DNA-binding protein [Runella slithyformis]|nr:MAG: single-stranded DNA-binding protein [Runella slithyformis]TAE95262.1 MAG: single-stranded DNA-binding protein [Runella slithyformis]TAF27196.1 MAG: single-stranded DNA-binding protein [Runella slithyformis]TAF45844.1 MAG: single-stranded DNA-binding protein [Runella slithyformis]TAF80671.1 MAG: single-stranded DNA-binding protein [Runella slithyformis]